MALRYLAHFRFQVSLKEFPKCCERLKLFILKRFRKNGMRLTKIGNFILDI